MERRAGTVVGMITTLVLVLSLPSNAASSDTSGPGAAIWCAITLVRDQRPSYDNSGQKVLAAFIVELVSRTDALSKGLSGRHYLPAEKGMLFMYDPKEPPAFWMKGMEFPLDIIFFDKEKRIIQIFEDLQPCERCRVVTAKEPVYYTLEINAGLSLRHDLRNGDIMVIEACE